MVLKSRLLPQHLGKPGLKTTPDSPAASGSERAGLPIPPLAAEGLRLCPRLGCPRRTWLQVRRNLDGLKQYTDNLVLPLISHGSEHDVGQILHGTPCLLLKTTHGVWKPRLREAVGKPHVRALLSLQPLLVGHPCSQAQELLYSFSCFWVLCCEVPPLH